MTHPLLVTSLVALATWDAWRWYAARIAGEPQEALSLLVTAALLAGFGLARRPRVQREHALPLATIAVLLAAYAASYLILPPIARAALAIALTLFCVYTALFREWPPVAFWGLVALALPVLPSLQFVLGYPMRIVSAAATVTLLQMQGLAVARQGTFLLWRGDMLQFDAPCSGVNMLWAGLLLTLMAATVFRLGPLKLALAVLLSMALTLACNVLRATSLFYVEAGFIAPAPAWWHDGIGIAAFVFSGAATLHLLTLLRDWRASPCAS